MTHIVFFNPDRYRPYRIGCLADSLHGAAIEYAKPENIPVPTAPPGQATCKACVTRYQALTGPRAWISIVSGGLCTPR